MVPSGTPAGHNYDNYENDGDKNAGITTALTTQHTKQYKKQLITIYVCVCVYTYTHTHTHTLIFSYQKNTHLYHLDIQREETTTIMYAYHLTGSPNFFPLAISALESTL